MVASFESFVVIVGFDIIVFVRLAPGGIVDEVTVTSVVECEVAFDGVLDIVVLFVVLVDKTVRLVEVGATVEFTVLPMVEKLLTFAFVGEMVSVAVDELLDSLVVLSVVLVSLTAGSIDTVFALVLSIVLDGANVELTLFTIDEGLLAVTVLVDGCKEMELELPFVGPVGPPAEPFADVDGEEGDDVVLTYVVESAGNILDVLKEEFTEVVLLELDPVEFVLATVGVVILTSVEPCIMEGTWLLE